MEELATNLTRCTVRGLAKEYALERHTADETECALEGLPADVTECTAKEFVANETDRVK